MQAENIDQLTPVFRPYRAEDLPFIYSSWLWSYWQATVKKTETPEVLYLDCQRALITKLLSNAAVTVLIVELTVEGTSLIAGWAMFQRFPDDQIILHYLYVLQSQRQQGLGCRLMDYASKPLIYTHTTKKFLHIARRRTSVFNPWILME